MMKKGGKIQGKRMLVGSIGIAMILALTSQLAAAEGRSIYFKVFNRADFIPDASSVVKVACDSYDDHSILYFDVPYDRKITQYDPILAVSVLCPAWEGHLDPVVHVDGNQSDNWEDVDSTDGYLDYIGATVYCKNSFPEFEGSTRPDRVILECLDHDAITITEKNK